MITPIEDNIIEKLIALAKSDARIDVLWLYGFQAKGTANERQMNIVITIWPTPLIRFLRTPGTNDCSLNCLLLIGLMPWDGQKTGYQ